MSPVMREVHALHQKGYLSDACMERIEKRAGEIKQAFLGLGGRRAARLSLDAARKLAPQRMPQVLVEQAWHASAANPALRQSDDLMRSYLASFERATGGDTAEDIVENARRLSAQAAEQMMRPPASAPGGALGRRLLGLGTIGVGAVAAEEGLDRARAWHSKQKMLELYPQLQNEDPDRVDRAYSVLQSYAPALTRNPHVAGSAVLKFMQFDVVDPATVKTLVDIQKADTGPLRSLLEAARAIAQEEGVGA